MSLGSDGVFPQTILLGFLFFFNYITYMNMYLFNSLREIFYLIFLLRGLSGVIEIDVGE